VKLGFIGCGNMASAIIGGILRQGLESPENIMASARREETLIKAEKSLGIRTTLENSQVAVWSDILFLAVKPQYLEKVLEEIRETIPEEAIIVSIAAGKTLEWLEERLGKDKIVIRTMPNTPALVGEGMTAVCANGKAGEKELSEVRRILECFGKSVIIPENLMDAAIAVASSSPAYVFLFIEALADGAVAAGMPRSQAYEFASQAVLGSAKMVLETGRHPGELKDMVCSPGGTTIEAVQILEKCGFRSAVMEAMKACVEKSRNL
jgi:pyrroline-5-carboxylate reductase